MIGGGAVGLFMCPRHIKDNHSPSSAGRRLFDLSGGVLFCFDCGWRMVGTSTFDPKTGRRYFYCECSRYRSGDRRKCGAKIRRIRADGLEPRIWSFISALILEPDRLRKGLEALIEEEERASRGDPEREAKLWYDKLQEAEQMRSGYQDLAARGLLTYEELGEKRAALEDAPRRGGNWRPWRTAGAGWRNWSGTGTRCSKPTRT